MSADDKTVSVERVIAAPAEKIFALLASPSRHTELDGSAMLKGSARGPDPLHQGAKFTMSMNQAKVRYRSINEVTVFEPDRAIAWETGGDLGPLHIGGHWWRYDLEPQADGSTRVVHTYEWGRSRQARGLKLLKYPERMGAAMGRTLERLEQAVTSHD